MALAIAIALSILFGVTGALALSVCLRSGKDGLRAWHSTRAELALIDRRHVDVFHQLAAADPAPAAA